MNILITNDDGIYSEGIIKLAEAVEEFGEIVIIGPNRERSATGHAITMHNPLRIEEITFLGTKYKIFAINGTPADCVKLGVEGVLSQRPDLVLSGINKGPNLGTDVIYSGTVSAAIEASIYGIPSIAFSLAGFKNYDFELAKDIVKKIVDIVIKDDILKKSIFNVNIPVCSREEIKGFKITKLGFRRYKDNFVKRMDPRGRVYYWLSGEVVEEVCDDNSDICAVRNKYVSITPIHFDLTDHVLFEKLKEYKLTI